MVQQVRWGHDGGEEEGGTSTVAHSESKQNDSRTQAQKDKWKTDKRNMEHKKKRTGELKEKGLVLQVCANARLARNGKG